jgi:hypothetical protein
VGGGGRPWGEAEERLRRLEERLGAARLGVLVVERKVEGVRDEGPRHVGQQPLREPAERLRQLLHRHVRRRVALARHTFIRRREEQMTRCC